jgi:hypothetical protein
MTPLSPLVWMSMLSGVDPVRHGGPADAADRIALLRDVDRAS